MNPEVRRYAEAYAEKMKRAGRDIQLNENELRFLDQVYGPEFAYNFQGLTPQLHFIDYKGSNRYIDFHYESGPIRVIIEVDSLKHHVDGITHQQYDDYTERQNDMLLIGGWMLVRLTANMIRRTPMICRRQLVQAVGKCLIASKHYGVKSEEQIWFQRKWEITQLADESGVIRVSDLVRRFGIHRKTASKWLQRMAQEGDLLAVKAKKHITAFKLSSQENSRRPKVDGRQNHNGKA